jgi:tRNA wybutosine-synthesizing protein 3
LESDQDGLARPLVENFRFSSHINFFSTAKMAPSRASLPLSFISKKEKILEQLAIPASQYDDLSPKGSIDEGIRDLIDEINATDGCVTTSSCAGRISIFLEGKKRIEEESGENVEGSKDGGEVETRAGVGGKGGGGRWLYVSHGPLEWRKHENKLAEFFGMDRRATKLSRVLVSAPPAWQRWVHFKFEPMVSSEFRFALELNWESEVCTPGLRIEVTLTDWCKILHILTATLEQAQMVLSAALQAGFRESGAISLVSSKSEPATPMVAVRSMGLGLESIIGFGQGEARLPDCTVSEESLETLVEQANERFIENTKRIERFRSLLKKSSSEEAGEVKRKGQGGREWENQQVRRERKRAEGLMRSQQLKNSDVDKAIKALEDSQEPCGLQFLDQNI